jgi:hypothetical protein
MGLAECGQLLNLPKLTIPAPYSITRMRQYLEADPEGFKTYALRDAEIAVRYALKVKDFCTRDLMLARFPPLLARWLFRAFAKPYKIVSYHWMTAWERKPLPELTGMPINIRSGR